MTKARTAALFAVLLAGLAISAWLGPRDSGTGAVPLLPASFHPAPDNPAPGGGQPPLNGIDFTGLTPDRVTTATQILGETRCNCGCGMTLAECRSKDPNCSRSLALARGVVQDLKDGKDRATVQSNLAAALAKAATPPPAAPAAPPPDANTVYKIDITGAPYKGSKSATVTIVEFSDYQ